MDNEEGHGEYFETQALCTMLSVYGEGKGTSCMTAAAYW
jgi:hypothetical protein